MNTDLLLLLALGGGAIVYLHPYWKLLRSKFEVVEEQVDIEVVLRRPIESLREPLFFLVAHVHDQSLGTRERIEVFPWHSDNVYRTRNEAEAALAWAGVLVSGQRTTIVVKTFFGAKKFVTAKLSSDSKREITLWLLVAAAIAALPAILWFVG